MQAAIWFQCLFKLVTFSKHTHKMRTNIWLQSRKLVKKVRKHHGNADTSFLLKFGNRLLQRSTIRRLGNGKEAVARNERHERSGLRRSGHFASEYNVVTAADDSSSVCASFSCDLPFSRGEDRIGFPCSSRTLGWYRHFSAFGSVDSLR